MKILILIQAFIANFVNTISSLAKIFILSKWNIKIRVKKYSNDCVILGNGPSLSMVIENEKGSLIGKDLLCVNYFAHTEYYELLKPRYYLINAPELWNNNVLSWVKENSEKLFKRIGEKTSWELFLFLPVSARKSNKWLNDIGDNKNIIVKYFNSTPVEGFSCINNFLFKYGFGMPRPHNVIIPSLIVTIRLMYKNIYLLGVDHSWLKDITVDDDNNVLINQKHFYDAQTSVPRTMHKGGVGKRKLYEVLQKFVYSFKGYFDIKLFALRQKVNIYNCTPDSYIDAFEKRKLSQI